MKLNHRELSTVLAALRYYQATLAKVSEPDEGIADIASDGGEVRPLTVDEIDGLCERINQ